MVKVFDLCEDLGVPMNIQTPQPDDNPKTKFGIQKPSMFNVPVTALLHLMGAMANGAKKYNPYNWRDQNVSASIYYDAAMRHLMAWIDGEDIAEDSGVHHLGHVMACCAIILDAEAQRTLNDNRPVKGQFSKLLNQMMHVYRDEDLLVNKPNIKREDTLFQDFEIELEEIKKLINSAKMQPEEVYSREVKLKAFKELRDRLQTLDRKFRNSRMNFTGLNDYVALAKVDKILRMINIYVKEIDNEMIAFK